MKVLGYNRDPAIFSSLAALLAYYQRSGPTIKRKKRIMDYKLRERLAEVGQVTRYHGDIGPIQQTIAAHSWGVAWLITEFHPAPRPILIKAALEHDMEEHLTSDVSYLSKKEFPGVRSAMEVAATEARQKMGIVSVDQLTEDEDWWLRWADLLEGALWCRYLSETYGFRNYGRRWREYCRALERHINTPATTFMEFPADAAHFTRSAMHNMAE